MSESLPQEWGHLDTGTEVTDTALHAVYRVYREDLSVILIDRTTKQRLAFEAVGRIDHQRYKIRLPS